MATRAQSQPSIADIASRVDNRERLGFDDGVRLFASNDVHTIGRLADQVRRRLHGCKTFYNVNLHINYTNYCVLRCKFCSFYRPYQKTPDAARSPAAACDGGYELSVGQVVDRARNAYRNGATEVHVVGGLHPTLPFDYYLDLCRSVRQACPRIHIKAFTAIEIVHFTRITKPRLSIREVLIKLREAGLDSLPGGGAEIFDDRVHEEAFKNKVGQQGWFDVHRAAHELGIFTNATMLYGHIEQPAERVTHLLKLREHQDASLESGPAAFNCIVPLSFIPEGSALADLPGPTGLTDLKTLAITRLLLDNVPNVKAFWPMLSPKVAQVSLHYGVNDLDGTVVYYDITKRQGPAPTHQELTVDQLRRAVTQAGFKPVERDSLYRSVVRDGTSWHVAEP